MKFIRFCLVLFGILISKEQFASSIYIKDSIVCHNQPVVLKDTHTPPTGLAVVNRYWNFDGTNRDTTSIDSVFHTYTNLTGNDTFTAQLITEYSNGSTALHTVNVFVKGLPIIDTFDVSRLITCPSRPLIFKAYSSMNPVTMSGLLDYRIEFGDLNAATMGSPTVSNYVYTYGNQGVYNAKYIITDANNCQASESIEIRIIKRPEVTFEPIHGRCRDSFVTYENRTAGRDSTWKWNWTFADSMTIDSVTGNQGDSIKIGIERQVTTENFDHIHPFFTDSAIVTLRGDNQYGCWDTITKIFKVDTTPLLVITPRADTSICFGESVQYTVRGSDTLWYSNFEWGNKIKGDSVVLFTPNTTITYTVFGKTPQCPPIGSDIKITVVKPVFAEILVEPNPILKGSVSTMKLDKLNGILDSIFWTPDTTLSRPRFDSTGAAPQVTTTYRVRMYYSLNNYSCFQEDSATIIVDNTCDIDSLMIPTAFTPNGDDFNDIFYVKSFALKTVLSFNIYNRWGNKVFSIEDVPADDKEYGWNGKINNNDEDVPVGMYIYNISAVCKNDQIVNFQGEITVLR